MDTVISRRLSDDDVDERERAFESKWAHDAETRFKAEARRNRSHGLWPAGEKGHKQVPVHRMARTQRHYVEAVIAADFEEEGRPGSFRKLRAELEPGKYSDALIRAKTMAKRWILAVAVIW